LTQIEAARAGRFTPEAKSILSREPLDSTLFLQRVAAGEIVILRNRNHSNVDPVAVGKGLRTKVNANLGTSTDAADPDAEIAKAKAAVRFGADTLMDLSTGGNPADMLHRIMEEVSVVIGTVPVYEAAVSAIRHRGALVSMTEDDIFTVLERQALAGVDFFTVHCGVTRNSIGRLRAQGRRMDIVSRGGSFLAAWMEYHDRENPFFERFDRVVEIAKRHDVTLSLGDGLRPGSILDASDRAQIQELVILGELAERARRAGVQVMIEGPGHVPLDQVVANIQIEKTLCGGAPFYVLGPLVTDVAPGYDHITSAIGGALAAAAGADFLCYVTPGEHLRLPDLEDVRQGVIAARIAAHAADIAKAVPGAADWDRKMSEARHALDWDAQIALSVDPDRARLIRDSVKPKEGEVCTMCGDFCAIRLIRRTFPESSSGCGLAAGGS
jgi:phosphomethylpyrimidine synthase